MITLGHRTRSDFEAWSWELSAILFHKLMESLLDERCIFYAHVCTKDERNHKPSANWRLFTASHIAAVHCHLWVIAHGLPSAISSYNSKYCHPLSDIYSFLTSGADCICRVHYDWQYHNTKTRRWILTPCYWHFLTIFWLLFSHCQSSAWWNSSGYRIQIWQEKAD